MALWDNLKKSATQVANKVTETATAAGQKVTETATTAAGAVSSLFKSATDSVANFTSLKVKELLRGVNLQASIDALNKHQKETGTDVSVLVDFIKRLKNFSEDGK